MIIKRIIINRILFIGIFFGVFLFFYFTESSGGIFRLFTSPSQKNAVAKINEKIVTKEEFLSVFQEMAEARPSEINSSDTTFKLEVLNTLINQHILLQEANKQKIELSPKEIDQYIERLKIRFKTEKEFQAELKKRNITISDLKKQIETEIKLSRLLIQEVYSKVSPVTSAEVYEYYCKHSSEFYEPPQVHLRHILIRVPKEASIQDRNIAYKRAEQALSRLRKGESFAKVANEMSDCESKNRGGDLGWIRKGIWATEPAFEHAAFNLSVGEISGIIETRYGFHILLIEGKKDERFLSFSEVSERIRQQLTSDIIKKRFNEYLTELKKKYQIKIYPENIP